MTTTGPAITCPQCGRVSHNPNDVEHRYCGACHQYHDQMPVPATLQTVIERALWEDRPPPQTLESLVERALVRQDVVQVGGRTRPLGEEERVRVAMALAPAVARYLESTAPLVENTVIESALRGKPVLADGLGLLEMERSRVAEVLAPVLAGSVSADRARICAGIRQMFGRDYAGLRDKLIDLVLGQCPEVAFAPWGPARTIAQQVFYEGDPEPDYHPRRVAMDYDGDIWCRTADHAAWRCCDLSRDWATLAATYGPLVTFALPSYDEMVAVAELAGKATP